MTTCPYCGAPAEAVAWHSTSSLRTAPLVRGWCLHGHWFVARTRELDDRKTAGNCEDVGQ
jgi:hypothetical protein